MAIDKDHKNNHNYSVVIMRNGLCRLICLVGVILLGCNNIRPETRTGPVIDNSRIVTVTQFERGLTTPPVTLFVKHFHYLAQPAAWPVLSTGANSPVTVFEDAAVYANSPVMASLGSAPMPSNIYTRVFTVPGLQTNGRTLPSVFLAPRQRFPATSILVSEPRVLVYIEGGPIYGGLSISGTLDPQVTAESTPTLLVDAQVFRAALASDGRSIIYVDIANRLYVLPKGDTNPRLVVDLAEEFGAVTIKAIQWDEQLFNTANIWLNRGTQDELWRTSASAAGLRPVFNPMAQPPTVSPGTITFWEEQTQNLGFDVWKVPDPKSFEE